MGIFSKASRWIKMLFSRQIEDEFNISSIAAPELTSYLARCKCIYDGTPDWIDKSQAIVTLNFAKDICSEIARLVSLGIKISIDGSKRGEWLQSQIDKIYFSIRDWVEFASAYGTIIIKPNGTSVDFYAPDAFQVVEASDGQIRGIVFYDSAYDSEVKKYYTRLEWHRFDGDEYRVTNKCFVSESSSGKGKPIDIKLTPWAHLQDDVSILNVDKPLFGVLRMPEANNIDPESALGLPIFGRAIQELEDLDIAYSRNAEEIRDSRRIVLLDSDRLMMSGKNVQTRNRSALIEEAGLPKYIKAIEGAGANDDIYHEINPSLNTETRLAGINALLSQIGYKCGFSNGYFVFNESHGISTATQVEADQQRTIQLIKDIRDKLENCLNGLIYALDKFADLYSMTPVGEYDVVYSFGDITYNFEEDKMRWWSYVVAGKVPAWKYFVKFEGMTEEEAKEMETEVQAMPMLFGDIGSEFDGSGGADVQGKSLNGAQTQSLIAIMAQFSAGEITEGQAVNLISTAIGISKDEARKILNGEL